MERDDPDFTGKAVIVTGISVPLFVDVLMLLHANEATAPAGGTLKRHTGLSMLWAPFCVMTFQ